MKKVLGEILGEPPLPWILCVKVPHSNRIIGCRSFATKEEALKEAKLCNHAAPENKYTVKHRDN